MFNPPILLVMFNRPRLAQKVFDRIRQIKPRQLFLAVDGPRVHYESDYEACKQSRAFVEQVDWECETKTLFREKNVGCGVSVSSAIDWFFSHVHEGIILEDDCLPSASFFVFCEELLNRYRNDNRVFHINGFQHATSYSWGSESYYFSRIPHVWGWATWKRAWQHYDISMPSFNDFMTGNVINNLFDELAFQKFWNEAFHRVFHGQLDTWDFQWVYTLFTQNGLCASSQVNLVSNIGFGSDATHTKNPLDHCANKQVFELERIIHPRFIIPSKVADRYAMINEFNVDPSGLSKKNILYRMILKMRDKMSGQR